MAHCRACSADITWTVDEEGNKIPIDDHEERDYGADRYVLLNNATPPTVKPIAEESPLRTYVDHRAICQQPRAI